MNEPATSHIRLSIVGIVCVSLFASLFVRLWYLQMIDEHDYKVAAEAIHLRTIHEQGPRGRILDRKGRVLVDNQVSRVVGLDHRVMRRFEGSDPAVKREAGAMSDRKELFGRVAIMLSSFGHRTKAPEIERLFSDKRYGPNDFVPIVDEVSEELEIYLAEHHDEFPGIDVKRRSIRTYPYGRTAAHLLGYVGRINERELAEREATLGTPKDPRSPESKTYGPEDEMGKNGIERSFEDDLRGNPGDTVIQVDARGAYIRTNRQPRLSPGNDVWLTLDIDLQRLAEAQLANWVAARNPSVPCDRTTACNAKEGAVVVTDPQTGSVLAMASYPTYDPAELVNGISTDLWKTLTDDARGKPMFNRALSGTFAPGSTFKLFTAHAALEKGFVTRDFVYQDTGSYKLEGCGAGKCEFSNAGKAKNYATNMVKALTVSSDTYFYRIGDQMWRGRDHFGPTAVQDSAFAFGLGERTGIDLPSEGAGRIGTPDWLANAYEQSPKAFDHGVWRVGDSLNVAIGQGLVDVTPIQLVNAYATFANGGTRYVPRIVSMITRPKDMAKPVVDLKNVKVIREMKPKVGSKVTFTDPGNYLAVYQGLQGVTQKASGTAGSAFEDTPTAWPMAGKTGTAQVSRKADTSIFVGFGPADGVRPAEYAITAIIPGGGFGADAAAPLALSILKPLSENAVPAALPETPLPGVPVPGVPATAPGGNGP